MPSLGLGIGIEKRSNALIGGGASFDETLCSYFLEPAHRILFPSSLKTIVLDTVTYPNIVYRCVVRSIDLTSDNTLFSVWDGTGNNRALWHRIRPSGEVQLIGSINGTSSWTYSTPSGVITEGGWVEIILAQHFGDSTGNRYDCYVNGVQQTFTLTGADSSMYTSSTADLHFGYVEPASNYLEGYVNQLSIWLDTTDLTEVQSLYNSGSPRLTRDIIATIEADYIFDNDTFNTTYPGEWAVIDDSGNAHEAQTENMDNIDRDCNENPY